ncbi:MAG: PQQ-dependent sugar dehydrogenase [Gaiellales bacterium]
MQRARWILAVGACAALVAGAALAGGSVSTVRLAPLARGFERPVLALQAPGEPGRVYVVEQTGYVRVLENGRRRSKPFLDVHARVSGDNEQGLLGLAFPPDYATRKRAYVNYTDGSGATVILELPVRNGVAQLSRARRLLRVAQPYANHNGGNLVFGPDGLLWVGLGDGGSGGDPERRAQSPQTLLGKLFTIDTRAARPRPKLVAIGLRNPWRYSFDRLTGDLWIGDVGQGDVEEVDVVRKAQLQKRELLNFGWDVFEGSRKFEDKPLGPGALVRPMAEYTHADGCSITGGFVYRGKAVPALRGRYLYGDYCTGTIWSLPASGGSPRVEPVEVSNLTSFGESVSGELYAVSQDGAVYRFAS